MRRRVVVLGAVVVLVAASAAWWFWWVPSWRPPLRDGERYGIDVSAHQGPIHWESVAADAIEFAYVKASEGGEFADQRAAKRGFSGERNTTRSGSTLVRRNWTQEPDRVIGGGIEVVNIRRLPAIAALLIANASLIASAPPAYAHCDDPHGTVEVLVCRAQCRIDSPDPWKCPSLVPPIDS